MARRDGDAPSLTQGVCRGALDSLRHDLQRLLAAVGIVVAAGEGQAVNERGLGLLTGATG